MQQDHASVEDQEFITMSSAPEAQYLHSWKLLLVISTLFLGIFLFGLDVNIIGVAIPKITTQFGSLNQVSWYGSAYLLTVTAFQPGFGSLYKYFNAKVIYLASLFIFEGMSARLQTIWEGLKHFSNLDVT